MLLRQRFRQWRQGRPFWGALLTILAGLELYLSGRLQLGGLSLQLGFAGMQSTILPLVLVVLGVLVLVQPVHHLFYGVIALIVSVYCLVAVNLGGFAVGTLLGVAGGIVVVSWMGRKDAAASDVPPPASSAAAEPEDSDPFLLFDDGPQPDPTVRRSVAAALSVALVAGGLAGSVPAEGPCILGFLLCDPTTASPSPSPSPSASAGPESTPSPSPSDLGGVLDGVGDNVDGVGDAIGDVVDGAEGAVDGAVDGAGEVVGDAVDGVGEAVDGTGDAPAQADQPPAPGLTVDVPQDVPLPADEGLPVVLGGNEDVDVYAVPAELTATDLEIAGIRAVALVSVPVSPGSEKRRNALKLVADHVKVTGFRLHTVAGADDRSGGTDTTADHVTMDGAATMYITSLTASGPDGSTFTIDADDPPPTLTSLVLAAVRPTVGLLGATSEQQVWSGFHEQVWVS